jgi:hypothetical protein
LRGRAKPVVQTPNFIEGGLGPMRFSRYDGSSFQLAIVGYEFPDLEGAPYDSNWLIISGRGEADRGVWQFRVPCLLTAEVTDLTDWFEARANEAGLDSEIGFIEPNLNFTWRDRALRIELAAESRPPWALASFYLSFSPSSSELASAVRSLRDGLREYPERQT